MGRVLGKVALGKTLRFPVCAGLRVLWRGTRYLAQVQSLIINEEALIVLDLVNAGEGHLGINACANAAGRRLIGLIQESKLKYSGASIN